METLTCSRLRPYAAEVTLEIIDPPMTLVTYSDILGRFRTADVGRTVADMGYDVEAKNFSVSVALEGYREIRHLKRYPVNAKPGAAYEVDFVMTADPSKRHKRPRPK